MEPEDDYSGPKAPATYAELKLLLEILQGEVEQLRRWAYDHEDRLKGLESRVFNSPVPLPEAQRSRPAGSKKQATQFSYKAKGVLKRSSFDFDALVDAIVDPNNRQKHCRLYLFYTSDRVISLFDVFSNPTFKPGTTPAIMILFGNALTVESVTVNSITAGPFKNAIAKLGFDSLFAFELVATELKKNIDYDITRRALNEKLNTYPPFSSPAAQSPEKKQTVSQPVKGIKFWTMNNADTAWMREISKYFMPDFKKAGITDAALYVHQITDSSRYIQRNFPVQFYPAAEIVIQLREARCENINNPHEDGRNMKHAPFVFTTIRDAVTLTQNLSAAEMDENDVNTQIAIFNDIQRKALINHLLAQRNIRIRSCISCGAPASLMHPETGEAFCADKTCHPE